MLHTSGGRPGLSTSPVEEGTQMADERLVPGGPGWPYYHADHVARYLFAVDYVRGKRVLDAGTGMGYGAALLKALGASAVEAIDIDSRAIATAQSMFGAKGIEFAVRDCETLEHIRPGIDVICNFEN